MNKWADYGVDPVDESGFPAEIRLTPTEHKEVVRSALTYVQERFRNANKNVFMRAVAHANQNFSCKILDYRFYEHSLSIHK